jgi:glycosyltransferase involved in cell wall biosynthesis
VLSQGYQNLQYIIIDGGSTDNSVEIIKKYEKHLHYWISEPDNGQSEAINKGLAYASGEVFNWLCSDDYYEPGALQIIGNAFASPVTKVLGGNFRILGSPIYGEGGILPGFSLEDNLPKTIARTAMTQPAAFFRLKDIKDLGGINPALHYFMDLDLWLKFLINNGMGNVQQVPDILVNYRVHPESKSYKELDNSHINCESKFTKEKNQLFYAWAICNGLNKEAEGLKTLLEKQSIDISNSQPNLYASVNNKDTIQVAINYYLYDFCRRLYYAKSYKKSLSLLPYINYHLLQTEDSKGFQYLKRKLFYYQLKAKLFAFHGK